MEGVQGTQLSEIISVLTFLLPGLVTGAIFHSLTSHRKPSAFDRLVISLIFTFLIQTIASLCDKVISSPSSILKLIIATILGILFSCISNKDILHKFLRKIRITKETSYPSEWHSMFAKHGDKAAIFLYLKSGERLDGQLVEWPRDPKDGYFRITKVDQLDAKNNQSSLVGDNANWLIPAAKVEMLNLRPMEEPCVPQESGTPAGRIKSHLFFSLRVCRLNLRLKLSTRSFACNRRRERQHSASQFRQKISDNS